MRRGNKTKTNMHKCVRRQIRENSNNKGTSQDTRQANGKEKMERNKEIEREERRPIIFESHSRWK